jgi:hypothetical protein
MPRDETVFKHLIQRWYDEFLTTPYNKHWLLQEGLTPDGNKITNLDIRRHTVTILDRKRQVVNLGGTIGIPQSPVKRSGRVTFGTDLFFPVLAKLCDGIEDPKRDLTECAKQFLGSGAQYELRVDDERIQDLDDFRITTDEFPVEFKENGIYSIFGFGAGKTKGVVDGIWIYIQLEGGKHVVHFKADALLPYGDYIIPYIGTNHFMVDVTYEVNVTPLNK